LGQQTEAPEADRTGLPKWATGHFKAALDRHEELMQITRLSAQGIAMHRARPNALRVLGTVRGGSDQKHEETIHAAEKDAELAETEIQNDYPVLHGLTTIALWSWLEDLVKGLVGNWFLHRPASMNAPAVHKLRVRLGDYLQLSRPEQARFLVELLEQDTASALKQGLPRFNSLLDVIGLSVNISEQSKKAIYEHHRVRNALAHRGGRVDAKLRAECPWLGQRPGGELRVSRAMLNAYAAGGGEFVLELLYKAGAAYGRDLRESDRAEEKSRAALSQASTEEGDAGHL